MSMRLKGLLLLGAVGLTACQENVAPEKNDADPAFGRSSAGGHPALIRINDRLAVTGSKYRVELAEWITTDGADEAGQRVFAKDRGNKQLDFHFLTGDPLGFLGAGSNDISYLVDRGDGAARSATATPLTNAQTEGAIDRSFDTWEGTTQCSKFGITKVADNDLTDPDLVDGILGFGDGVIGTWRAHITHGGWMAGGFFDALAPGGSTFILGVTFTFIFVDENGNPIDTNRDGKGDAAFREVYYNNEFRWGIDVSTNPYDVETVSLHESGHGLSQGHFGMIFRTLSNGRLHFSPFAVMNAAISRQAQDLEGTDGAGHCSIWGNWPNK